MAEDQREEIRNSIARIEAEIARIKQILDGVDPEEIEVSDQAKTYSFEGRDWKFAGEHRPLEKGDVYLLGEIPIRWNYDDSSKESKKILVPVSDQVDRWYYNGYFYINDPASRSGLFGHPDGQVNKDPFKGLALRKARIVFLDSVAFIETGAKRPASVNEFYLEDNQILEGPTLTEVEIYQPLAESVAYRSRIEEIERLSETLSSDSDFKKPSIPKLSNLEYQALVGMRGACQEMFRLIHQDANNYPSLENDPLYEQILFLSNPETV